MRYLEIFYFLVIAITWTMFLYSILSDKEFEKKLRYKLRARRAKRLDSILDVLAWRIDHSLTAAEVQEIYGLPVFKVKDRYHLQISIYKRLNRIAKKNNVTLKDLCNVLTVINWNVHWSVIKNNSADTIDVNQALQVMKMKFSTDEVSRFVLNGIPFSSIVEMQDLPIEWITTMYKDLGSRV